MNPIYTIGYEKSKVEDLISTLTNNSIDVVVDVRSIPYSKYYPSYNKEYFGKKLHDNNIKYLFMGDKLGAKNFSLDTVEGSNKIDYSKIRMKKTFQEGINRLHNGIKKFNICLFCSEKDPIFCHRNILICKELKGYEVLHLYVYEETETSTDAENRLLTLHGLEQDDMFLNHNDRLEKAYELQSYKIAFEAE